jgi:hypothetical protein
MIDLIVEFYFPNFVHLLLLGLKLFVNKFWVGVAGGLVLKVVPATHAQIITLSFGCKLESIYGSELAKRSLVQV